MSAKSSKDAITFWCTHSDFTLNMGETKRKMHGKDVNVPKKINFQDGIYTTADMEEIEALRACSIYGIKLHEEDKADTIALEAAQKAFKGANKAKVKDLAGAFNPNKK